MSGVARSITALDAPTMTTAASNLVVGARGTVTFPVPAFLIEHDGALVLFDTGFPPVLNDDPFAYLGERAEHLRVNTHPGQRIDRQLARLGLAPQDVSHVVLSHAHSDHAGAVSLFTRSRLLVGPGELSWARQPSRESAPYFRWETELAPVPLSRWHEVRTPEHDLLGDGSIVALHLPGHTPGELALRVRLPSRTMVLTGDTVHLRDGLDLLSPYPFDWDVEEALTSLRTLRALEAHGHQLWIAHDPGDWDRFGPLQALT